MNSLNRLTCLLFLFLFVTISYSYTANHWLTQWGNPQRTRYFSSDYIPSQKATRLTKRTIQLPFPIEELFYTADVTGDGKAEFVSLIQDPPSILIVDLTNESYEQIPLEKSPHLTEEDTEIQYEIIQLVDYDGEPGLEVFCEVLPVVPGSYYDGKPTFYQIVSPRLKKVIHRFSGITIEDRSGDGMWSGSEIASILFKDQTDQWKMAACMSAGHEDYKPRSINIYNIENGQLEAQFHTATSTRKISLLKTESDEILITLWSHTPDNWIRINGEIQYDEDGNKINVSEILDEKVVTDKEGYSICLNYNGSLNEDALQLRWYSKIVDYCSINSAIIQDSLNRNLAVDLWHIVRAWDPLSAGGICIFDLETGETINEFQADEGLSFEHIIAPPHSDRIYTRIYELPHLVQYNIQNGESKIVELSDNSIVQLELIGAADMDGGGEYDIVVMSNASGEFELIVLDTDLNEKTSIPIPPSYKTAVFGDANQDGYPEVYLIDQNTNQSLTIIEYGNPSSFFPFNDYK